jgi:HrpA-like RNA helicase
MAALPAHPRLSHMVLRAQQLQLPELGCLLAALLSERDLFRPGSSSSEQRSADLAARLRVLLQQGGCALCGLLSKRVLHSEQQVWMTLACSSISATCRCTHADAHADKRNAGQLHRNPRFAFL